MGPLVDSNARAVLRGPEGDPSHSKVWPCHVGLTWASIKRSLAVFGADVELDCNNEFTLILCSCDRPTWNLMASAYRQYF